MSQTLYIYGLNVEAESTPHSICSKYCHQVRPLLTKLITCLGEGARLSRHPEYTCTHTGSASAINTEVLLLPRGSDSTAKLLPEVLPESYYCLNHICFSGSGKRKTNSGWIQVTFDVINVLFLLIKLLKLIRLPCFSFLLSS